MRARRERGIGKSRPNTLIVLADWSDLSAGFDWSRRSVIPGAVPVAELIGSDKPPASMRHIGPATVSLRLIVVAGVQFLGPQGRLARARPGFHRNVLAEEVEKRGGELARTLAVELQLARLTASDRKLHLSRQRGSRDDHHRASRVVRSPASLLVHGIALQHPTQGVTLSICRGFGA